MISNKTNQTQRNYLVRQFMAWIRPTSGINSTRLFAWVLIAPAAAYMCLIVAWPLLETVRLSFTNAGIGIYNQCGRSTSWTAFR